MYLMISTDELASALEQAGLIGITNQGEEKRARSVAAMLRATLERQGFVITHRTDLRTKLQVGDLISSNAKTVPAEVVRVIDAELTNWERAEGDDRYPIDDLTHERDRSQAYNWIASGGGGWTTDEGLIVYAPLTVTEVSS